MSGYILIVHQDSSSRLSLLETLKNSGFTTKTSSSGEECLRLSFSDERPSLILLGLDLPILNGIEILTLLKLNGRSEGIPVIIADEGGNKEEQAIKAGAFAFLTKPYNPVHLLSHTRRALGLV